MPRMTTGTAYGETYPVGIWRSDGTVKQRNVSLRNPRDDLLALARVNANAEYAQATAKAKAKAKANLQHNTEEKDNNVMASLRIVRVFLVDPDERLDVSKRVLHASEEKTTDETDEELFYQLSVPALLTDHNKLRAEQEWEEDTDDGVKKHKGLKEARIRDLEMRVVVIAEF